MKFLAWRGALLCAAALLPLTALADGRGHHPGGGPPAQWHGATPYLHPHGATGGQRWIWRYGHRNGLPGWWGTVNGIWFFYPGMATYPPGGLPPELPGAAYWYYCSDPAGYYPYVSECWDDWQVIPAPAAAPPQ